MSKFQHPRQQSQVAIVNNHWMPYKELLFRALACQEASFTAIFSSLSSGKRESPQLGNSYKYKLLHDKNYEQRPRLKVLIRLMKNLEAIRPSVVIIEGWYDISSWGAWLWASFRQVPMVLWSESNEFDRPRHAGSEWVKRLFASKVSNAHVYGRSNKAYLQTLGLPEDRILTGRAVIDTHSLSTCGELCIASPLSLLYVGRLAPEKNLAMLCRAFARFVKESGSRTKLTLTGSGESEAALKSLVSCLQIGAQIKFEESVPYSRLRDVYRKAHVFVLPSTTEPWGLVAAEAMCSGLPAIVSKRCGCAADLITAETGWLFESSSEDNLVEVLQQVEKTPFEKLKYMGKCARERASAYSPERAATLVVQSVEHAMAHRP